MGSSRKEDRQAIGAPLWERVTLIRRIDNGALIVYRCFRDVVKDEYCVQSADRLYPPIDQTQLAALERQYWELLSEQDPGERSGVHRTVAGAIRAFDAAFDDGDHAS